MIDCGKIVIVQLKSRLKIKLKINVKDLIKMGQMMSGCPWLLFCYY